ncbi:enoyl-CoA hydratase/isomerase family protein [Halalkalibacterium halodurans]|uniref:Enoyl-CoA hydratase n=1 Tax=Halalkalibacterium halodurans (strain ATCC BAA-125 / DSM 18197 / FERM 7344 / JCM 9153 / C-125) TaxID=272558 RepID=Q9K9R3_HALH5|nr:enoyl-CoA hydratase/isomerase family protein [Halalkalibacterium halodurans]MED3647275.1 enoyl-CoA hydratase/isomerase family protein [Halalkalibacterium halodurans]MED4079726.1 enoyl-CoA hydratase/isomerase family protein [Halalkalibacterium halodurans]MED4086332.1 enoyl-CoA hydratase/isomerase family protein [Halalkalibacterium halodurans]MED4103323.1 enoyl-CoA hydratase/isomerase family protein [Halalkalibacterium halodurans]MED4107980.1 enoyl-CoA hydratase/isomerase family protein [Hala
MSKVLYIQDHDVTWIQFNRPEKRNAIDEETMDQFAEALAQAKGDQSKVIIVTGAGEKAFCAGGDLSSFHKLKTESEAKAMLAKMAKILLDVYYCPKLTVAALNGAAVGGGCEIAAACDIRLAAPHSKFGFIQGTLGITTGWGGTSFLMTRVQPHVSLEMTMTGKVYSSDVGENLGFIQKVIQKIPFREGVKEWLGLYTVLDQEVLIAYKERHLDRISRKELIWRIEREVAKCAQLWERDAHHEAVDAFLRM